MIRPVAECSGCGFQTSDRRAVTCCKGYCFDPTGNSCNAPSPARRAAGCTLGRAVSFLTPIRK
jgi:hypothetical protein